MLEPKNTNLIRSNSPDLTTETRRPSVHDYTDLLENYTPAPPDTPAPAVQARRRVSLHVQNRNAADALTHPSRNYNLPFLATRDAKQAEGLLSDYCARMCDWGLATFEQASPEARLLHELKTLNILLKSSAQARAADPSAYETEAHASAVLSLSREVMNVKDHVTGFRLSFEVDKHLYDIVEVTQCLHSSAVSTLLGLFLST
jgi:hypothetical protein